MADHSLTIAIPTYGRDSVLVETIQKLHVLSPHPYEIIVLDQTPKHQEAVMAILHGWDRIGAIRWVRLVPPSIPKAMNRGLSEAQSSIVLFVDDDIFPEPDLIKNHLAAHRNTGASLIAGRVVQPWQEGLDFSNETRFHFATTRPSWIDNFMGGNFSVRRDVALDIGGFDENFVRVAYNFEAEFAYRLRRAGHRIFYEPQACLRHLKTGSGGTRTFGNHLKTAKPDHAVGAYYYILRTWRGWKSLGRFLQRPLRAIATAHHLRRPWWIPATLCAELWGMAWAFALAIGGPKYATKVASSPRSG